MTFMGCICLFRAFCWSDSNFYLFLFNLLSHIGIKTSPLWSSYSFGIDLNLNTCLPLSDPKVCGVFHRTQHHGHAHDADQQTPRCRYPARKKNLKISHHRLMADVKPLDITWNSDEPPPGLCQIDQRNNRKTAAFRSFPLSQVKRRLVTQCIRTCTTSRSGRRTGSCAPGPPWRKWTGRMAAWSSCRELTPEPCRSMTTPNGRYKPINFFKKCNCTRRLGTHLNIMPCVFRVA